MELEALKASWNKLDERLAATEIVNLRVGYSPMSI